MEENKRKGRLQKIIKMLAWLLPPSVILGVAVATYKNHLKVPVISSRTEGNKMTLLADSEYRGLTIRLYPQLLIKHKDNIVHIVDLKKFYKEYLLEFDQDNRCNAEVLHQPYFDKLKEYLKHQIENEISLKGIDDDIFVELSVLGFVRYQNLRGQTEKRYCVVIENGMVFDMALSYDEVKSRISVPKTEIRMRDSLRGIEYNKRIEEMVKDVSTKIEENVAEER